MDLGGVFRSRLKYVLPAAALTLILYLALGSRGEAADLSAVQSAAVRPTALLFLLVPVVVVVFCLLQRHLLEALSYGIVTGVLLGLVTGTITGKVKGGLTVMTNGIRAFLPGSLVDLRPVKDTTPYEGKTLEFKVIKLDRKRNNVVLSRRQVLEASMGEERQKLLETLHLSLIHISTR